MMSKWKQDRLEKIASSDDLHIAPLRDDGFTMELPPGFGRWLWTATSTCVRTTGFDPVGTWLQSSKKLDGSRLRGKIRRSTSKQWPEKSTNASTLHKYFSSPYLRPMIADGARAATVQLIALRDGHKCSARLLWGPVRKRTIEHAKTAWTVN